MEVTNMQLLFTELRIPYPLPLKKGEKPSAKKDVLEKVQETQPSRLIGIILAWRTLDGLRKTVEIDGRYRTNCERYAISATAYSAVIGAPGRHDSTLPRLTNTFLADCIIIYFPCGCTHRS